MVIHFFIAAGTGAKGFNSTVLAPPFNHCAVVIHFFIAAGTGAKGFKSTVLAPPFNHCTHLLPPTYYLALHGPSFSTTRFLNPQRQPLVAFCHPQLLQDAPRSQQARPSPIGADHAHVRHCIPPRRIIAIATLHPRGARTAARRSALGTAHWPPPWRPLASARPKHSTSHRRRSCAAFVTSATCILFSEAPRFQPSLLRSAHSAGRHALPRTAR